MRLFEAKGAEGYDRIIFGLGAPHLNFSGEGMGYPGGQPPIKKNATLKSHSLVDLIQLVKNNFSKSRKKKKIRL